MLFFLHLFWEDAHHFPTLSHSQGHCLPKLPLPLLDHHFLICSKILCFFEDAFATRLHQLVFLFWAIVVPQSLYFTLHLLVFVPPFLPLFFFQFPCLFIFFLNHIFDTFFFLSSEIQMFSSLAIISLSFQLIHHIFSLIRTCNYMGRILHSPFSSESMDHNSNLSLVSLLNSCAPLSVMSAWYIPNCGWLWAFSAVAPELLSSVGEKYRVRQINGSINTGPSPHLSSQHYPANLCHSLNNSLLHSPWEYTSPGASLASPSLCPPSPSYKTVLPKLSQPHYPA